MLFGRRKVVDKVTQNDDGTTIVEMHDPTKVEMTTDGKVGVNLFDKEVVKGKTVGTEKEVTIDLKSLFRRKKK